MDFLSTAFRCAIPQVAEYAPYSFSGAWDECDKTAIKTAIDPHVPEAVYPTFNNWLFSAYDWCGFTARRATWTMGSITADTAQELAEQVAEYYAGKE